MADIEWRAVRVSGAILAMILSTIASAAEKGLAAHYVFDERADGRIRDVSGRGHHGENHGAEFLDGASGRALHFQDGDYVSLGDPPGLKFDNSVSIVVWVYFTTVPRKDHSLIVGRAPHGFGLCEHVMAPYALWYATGWERDYCSYMISRHEWHHVAATFDGSVMKLYVDGRSVRTKDPTTVKKVDNRGEFRIGGYHFEGVLGEVRVYSRALAAEEVGAQFEQMPRLPPAAEVKALLDEKARTARRAREPVVMAHPHLFDRRLDVAVDLRAMSELPQGTTIRVAIKKAGQANPSRQTTMRPRTGAREATVTLADLDLAPADYAASVEVATEDGRIVGSASSEFTWSEAPRWAGRAEQVKVLNCLVTELLNVAGPVAEQYEFDNPRDANLGGGWVFISATRDADAPGGVRIAIDSTDEAGAVIRQEAGQGGTAETMRHLSNGRHSLRIGGPGRRSVRQLVVRSIPELIYSRFPNTAKIAEYGPYDWQYLLRHVVGAYNTINGGCGEALGPFMRQWKARGGRWVDSNPLPYSKGPDDPLTGDRAYEFWTSRPAYQDPLADGTHADEFHGGSAAECASWCDAIRRIHKDFPTKVFYPYCGTVLGAGGVVPTVVDCDFGFAWERYFPEAPTEFEARRLIWRELKEQTDQWRTEVSGSEKHMILNFSHWMSSPPETTNVNPGVDFKVYMDMMYNLAANHPAFFGLYGIESYTASVADEESIRWAARLNRHYCIEGRTGMLSTGPYVLPHIENADFDDAERGWTFGPTEPGSMAVRLADGYGVLQGRWFGRLMTPDHGNHFLWTKRSQKGPNVASQRVEGLRRGAWYSAKMISADWGDLSIERKLGVSIRLAGVEVDADRSFQSVVRQIWHGGLGYEPKNRPAFFNYHLVVFKAVDETATLTISDWASPDAPGGPAGQEFAFNFIEVQPYLGD